MYSRTLPTNIKDKPNDSALFETPRSCLLSAQNRRRLLYVSDSYSIVLNTTPPAIDTVTKTVTSPDPDSVRVANNSFALPDPLNLPSPEVEHLEF